MEEIGGLLVLKILAVEEALVLSLSLVQGWHSKSDEIP